jgi:RHS repeat-associated protein
VEQILFTNGSALRMTTTKQYDSLNRLTNIPSVPTASSAVSFAYTYNSANQRTAVTNADNSHWVYTYDSLGQVISGRRYWSDGTPVAGQQFEYAFDDIGNRKSTAYGGDSFGTGLHAANYTNNSLNQITSRSVPGFVNILGSAATNATVLVNNQATHRKGEYFRKELAVTNSTAAVWFNVTNLANVHTSTNDVATTNKGNTFIPKTAEVFGYDLDGNMTNDGRWALTWDAENRLVRMESQSSGPSASKRLLEFTYDQQNRRVQKIVSTNNGSAYVPQYTNRFVYDGWNLTGILSPLSSLLTSFTWGLDLSGSMQGAGGVGGLLMINDSSTISNQPSTHFTAFDGNGNVAVLANATSGTASANYEYGPFGEVLRATGQMAKANPLRFSTKYQDDETDQLYYGYRYYHASTGRWVGRDPVEDFGTKRQRIARPLHALPNATIASYLVCANDTVSKWDYLGLDARNGCPASEGGLYWTGYAGPIGFSGVIRCIYGKCGTDFDFAVRIRVEPGRANDVWMPGPFQGVLLGYCVTRTTWDVRVLTFRKHCGCAVKTVYYSNSTPRVRLGEESNYPGSQDTDEFLRESSSFDIIDEANGKSFSECGGGIQF